MTTQTTKETNNNTVRIMIGSVAARRSVLAGMARQSLRKNLAASMSAVPTTATAATNYPTTNSMAYSSSQSLSASSAAIKSTTIRSQSTAAAAATNDELPSPSSSSSQQEESQSKPFVPTPERKYEYFTNVEMTPEGVAIVRFDCPKKVNSISFALSEEAKVMWRDEIENNPDVKAVVFSSAKPDMFIAGADIFDIKKIENKQDLVGLIEDGMNMFQNMRAKKVPLVCAIDGPALGGGLEWAMWCDYRVASDSPKTKLGLPEVKLVRTFFFRRK